MRLSFGRGLLLFLASLLPSLPTPAHAQSTQPQEASPAASPESESCFPACRTGYVCARGACVSRCNPPCGADETCTAQGECAARPPPAAQPVAPQDEWKSQRFFFRAGGGAGYFDVERTVNYVGFSSNGVTQNFPSDTTLNGPGAVGELSLGGVVAQGLVVGGEVFGTSATLKDSQGSGIGVNATYVQVGPFVDYFFQRHGGPHLLASTGYVVRENAGAWGLSAGAGYDFPIGAGWQLGGLLRAAFSPPMSNTGRSILALFAVELSYR
jgi:hypothetical protein